MQTKRPPVRFLLFIVALAFMAGCATHQVDWGSRIGKYSFDQAVVELGPPDKQAKLSNGQTVAEWITRYSHGGSISVGTGFYHHGGMGVIQTAPTYYEKKLRLTFSQNNLLTAWVRN